MATAMMGARFDLRNRRAWARPLRATAGLALASAKNAVDRQTARRPAVCTMLRIMRPLKTLLVAPLVALVFIQCGGLAGDDRQSSTEALEVCKADWTATWQQRSGANEWWVEYGIGGATVANAHLEVVSDGRIVPLTLQWGKWVGSSVGRIPRGSLVIVHAETAAGLKAQTKPFGYLDVAAPTSDPCAVVPPEAGTDAGNDGGACTNVWTPTWSQGSGANEWWAEYAVAGGNATSVSLEVVGYGSITLSKSWSKWVGPTGFRVAKGTQVIVHATNLAGDLAETVPFAYLVNTAPTTKPCTVPDGGTDAGTDAGNGDITAADIYDPGKVLTYEIGVDAAAMAILESTLEADQKTWVHGTFKCGNVTFADVGVRRKGTSTFRALPQKAALKIRFDKYVSGQLFVGFRDLTLNNSVSDPTFIAERLSYHVFREVGLPAMRTASAQVAINGTPYGLYVNVETPGKQLIARLFGANAKTLYEINWGSEWLPGQESGFEEDVGDGTLADVAVLFNAVQAANNATLLTDVASVLDTTEWLKFSATEAAVGHYDGYGFGIWGSHNYYMAGDVNGRFSLIPWSTDLTMSNRESVVNANEPLGARDNPTLLVRCKQSTACWDAYKAQAKTVLAKYETLNLVPLAQTWHAQVHPLVLADTKREAPLSYYASETQNLYTWLGARPSVMRAQLGITP